MKIKRFFHLLNLRGKPRHFAYKMHDIDLGNGAAVHYARWMHPHPNEAKKTVTPQMIDAYREFLSEGDFCIGIEAHMGDTTLPMAFNTAKNYSYFQNLNRWKHYDILCKPGRSAQPTREA